MDHIQKTAIIAGATGLVGGELLKLLLADAQYNKVTVLTRRSLSLNHDKVTEVVTEFDELKYVKEHLYADVVFCCLGTTMKKAGTKEKFRKVDHDYPLKIAEIAKQNDCNRFMVISAMGANHDSSIFYNKVNGETERDIAQVGFDAYHIIRPSLIIGDRRESRPLEHVTGKASILFNKLLLGPLKKYRSISAAQIARAMHAIANLNATGNIIHTNDELSDY